MSVQVVPAIDQGKALIELENDTDHNVNVTGIKMTSGLQEGQMTSLLHGATAVRAHQSRKFDITRTVRSLFNEHDMAPQVRQVRIMVNLEPADDEEQGLQYFLITCENNELTSFIRAEAIPTD